LAPEPCAAARDGLHPPIGRATLWLGPRATWASTWANMLFADGHRRAGLLRQADNCPFHIEIYKSQMRSYRDCRCEGRAGPVLPIREERRASTACCASERLRRRTTRTSSAHRSHRRTK
jgi:prepilin-type processing-associated H-X9-DG protein